METAHFQLMSGADRGVTLWIAQGLELAHALLEREGLAANLVPRVPLSVCVFADTAELARFQPASGIEPFLLPRPHRSFLVVSGDRAEARADAIHEYVHFVLRNGEALHYPAWYDEGLAEFLSTVGIEEGHVTVGTIPRSRADWLLYGNALSLRRLVTARDLHQWSEQARWRFSSQAWATVHFFHVADRAGFPARHGQMLRYIALLSRGSDPDAAWEEAFGAGLEELERELMLYLGQDELPYLGLRVAEIELSEESRAQALLVPDKELLLADLALSLGEDRRHEASLWATRAVRSRPRDARAHAALGRALAGSDPAAAEAELALALELDAADPEVQRLAAEAWIARAEGAESDAARSLVTRARDSFRRSIELAPTQVAAYAGLGRSFLVAPDLGDPAEGRQALELAHRRLPADRSILLSLARLDLAEGRMARARSLLTRMPPASHGEPEAEGQRALLEAVRRGAGLPTGPSAALAPLEARLEVEAPRPGERIRGLAGWVEVAGRGGLREARLHDLAIAIDASSSTLSPPAASSEPDDTVLRAELEAAGALVRRLDADTTRVALLTFARTTRTLAALGPPDAALAALATHPVRADPSGTSLSSALLGALAEFRNHREPGVRRLRTILLLSDGQPTAPSVEAATREALELADWLGRLGVPVQAFALGEAVLENPGFYQSLAERSGGSFVPVADPKDVAIELAKVRLTGLEGVSIRSSPGGGSGRAVRVFADGSFDAYVPLVEGRNVVAIRASLEGGPTLSARRVVFYERPAEPTPEHLAQAARLHRALETRALEVELLAEIRARSSSGSRRIRLETERADDPSGAP